MEDKKKRMAWLKNKPISPDHSRKSLQKLTIVFRCPNMLTGFNKIPELFLTFF